MLLPVSPTAPPKTMTLSLPIWVTVWPNLAWRLSPLKLKSFYIVSLESLKYKKNNNKLAVDHQNQPLKNE